MAVSRKPRTARTGENLAKPTDAGSRQVLTSLPPIGSTGAPVPTPAVAPVLAAPVAGKPKATPARKPRNDPSGDSPQAALKHSIRPVVCLDTRKLTNVQVKKMEVWQPSNRDMALDSFMTGWMDQNQQKFGRSSVLIAEPDSNSLVCIPCPALAFEYLIGQDGMPLGLILHINGPKGTGKSALGYEFQRWFVIYGGLGELEEVESKFSEDLFLGVTRLDRGQKRISMNRCGSVEDWQQRLLYNLKWPGGALKNRLMGTKEAPGPGRSVAVCFLVDSIMGKLSQESQEKIQKAGFAGRSFPLEALSITGFMKTIPHLIEGWPFCLILNNHLKFGTDDQGRETAKAAGGAGVGFQESFEIRTSVRKRKIECLEWEGVVYNLQCTKNSFGPTYHSIDTRLLWWDEKQADGTYLQRHVWDWHWATIKMLHNIKEAGGTPAAKLAEVFKLNTPTTSDVENTAFSPTLGMKSVTDRRNWPPEIAVPDKEAPVSWSELGQVIALNEPLKDKIRAALGIRRRAVLQGDYSKQLLAIKAKLR